jgi:lipid-A-disaccharide synthase
MGLPSSLLVARESLRALAQGALLLPRGIGYLARREQELERVRNSLRAPAPAFQDATLPPLPRRLRIFVSAAERSGEIHAVNLVRALRRLAAAHGVEQLELSGLGGEALGREGVRLVGTPVERAQMGLSGLGSSLGYWLGLVRAVAEDWREHPIDVFVPVDSPALHVPLARIAQSRSARVVHFVAPQYWGWAPWRVRAYRRCVDRALTILPFEPAWHAAHGVRHAHVGHPLLDELLNVPATRPDAGARKLLVLPGSRASVIERNLPWMLERARALPQAELVVVAAGAAAAEQCRRHVEASGLRARVSEGRLHEELGEAHLALSVSGTILTDVLHHRVPAVVIYRLGSAREAALSRRFLSVPWFASINLLANEELLPEFGFHGDGPVAACEAAMLRLWSDEAERGRVIAGLERAAARLGPSGACERAARWVLAEAGDLRGKGSQP